MYTHVHPSFCQELVLTGVTHGLTEDLWAEICNSICVFCQVHFKFCSAQSAFPSEISEFILIKTRHPACCCSRGDVILLHLVFLWKVTKGH